MKISRIINLKIYALILTLLMITGCSFHFDQGIQLEQEGRWAEAAIEYRIASVENPNDKNIQQALTRMNIRVAQDNYEVYLSYLEQKEYHKAYRRLETALIQNPDHLSARAEIKKWWHLLITGKVELKFDRLSSNLRLADEMLLQVKINTPSGRTLSGNISSETGIFFLENLVYKTQPKQLAEYTINSIGLKIKRKSAQGIVRREFNKFINFRELTPLLVSGRISNKHLETPQNVLDHRPLLLTNVKPKAPWYPPRLVSYELKFSGNSIKVISGTARAEYAPSVLYLNKSDRRANLDFGVYQLQMNGSGRKWSIKRKSYRTSEDDYYYNLSSNISLNRYFYFDSVFRFIL
ncbi:MAG: hypothetical protein H8E38_02755 [SAR324 cluster bacterium]|nr:hypothetical protein [SAR324 cluster bacterium]MBL7035835.1 hypothetical protein [SAR324 cluster bacterium]